MIEPTELFAIGIDGSRSVYVRKADGSWPCLPTHVEVARPTERGAVEGLDWAAIGHDHADKALAGGIPQVRSPQYALSGVLTAMAREIERLRALTPPVTVAATDQAGEVERLVEVAIKADPYREHRDYRTDPIYEYEREPLRPAVIAILAALGTQPATGRTVGGEEERRVRARLQAFVDWAEADDGSKSPGICPDDIKTLLAALQNGGE